jgi:hypothetical protein
MEEEKTSRPKDASGSEPLWAVHIQGPDDLIAMTSRAAADRYATELNTLHEAQTLGREGTLPRMSAVVIPSPWPELEHWRYCAEIQEQWIEELEARLRSSPPSAAPRAYLVPDDEQMARAWYGAEYGPGHTIVPGYVRNYTVELLSSLPARALGGATPLPARTMPKTELLARAIQRALTTTAPDATVRGTDSLGQGNSNSPPAHLRDVVHLLRQWGVIDKVESAASDLVGDEMCNRDYYAAQMASAFDSHEPIEVWRAAYAAALNRCTL